MGIKKIGINVRWRYSVILLLICFLCLFLGGCFRDTAVDLRWQKYPFTLTCGLKCDGRFDTDSPVTAVIEVIEPYAGTITITAPESMCGYSVSLHDGKADFSYEEITVPCGEKTREDIVHFFSLFTLSAEHLNEITVSKQNGISINKAVFTTFDESKLIEDGFLDSGKTSDEDSIGTVAVYLSADDGIPHRMEAEFVSGETLFLDIYNYS